MILFGHIDHAKRIARASGSGFDPDIHYVISREVDGELLGGVIYTNWTGRTVQMHQAGFTPYWWTPQLLWVVFDFPFNHMKVEQAIATVPSTNERALKITRKMGFQPVCTLLNMVPGGHMEVHSMLREHCKYLRLGWRYAAMENAA